MQTWHPLRSATWVKWWPTCANSQKYLVMYTFYKSIPFPGTCMYTNPKWEAEPREVTNNNACSVRVLSGVRGWWRPSSRSKPWCRVVRRVRHPVKALFDLVGLRIETDWGTLIYSWLANDLIHFNTPLVEKSRGGGAHLQQVRGRRHHVAVTLTLGFQTTANIGNEYYFSSFYFGI